ncbi:GL21449 [Drosophila persimilis]|uniref:GL21449 n=1 Tax=Drosophila persimilis TaxID=7234 RepID=B4HCC8_DROPE|nr:GL21449 [Drosophila persimilis]
MKIYDYATLIGIDPLKEHHLLYLAKEGLMAALPSEWKICYSEEKNGHYYHNTFTKQSQWDHPLDAVYRELVEKTRHNIGAIIPEGAMVIIDSSDDISQLDSGIRSMHCADEFYEINSPFNSVKTQASMINSVSTHTTSFAGASVFSGGVNRFLESRTRNFGQIFNCVKNAQLENGNTNSPISMNTHLSASKLSHRMLALSRENEETRENSDSIVEQRDGMFLLSGASGSRRFLKPRQNLEQVKIGGSTPLLCVKGILRESSVFDINRCMDRDDPTTEFDDKKSVRFNLEEMHHMRDSPEDEFSPKLCQTSELSVNLDDEEVEAGMDYDFNEDRANNMFKEQDALNPVSNRPFDLDELGRKHSHELELLQRKSAEVSTKNVQGLKMASKLGTLYKQTDSFLSNDEAIKREHEVRLKNLRHEYDLRFTSHQHQLEEAFESQIEKYRGKLELQLQSKRSLIVSEHKARMAILQSNHSEILNELERDLHSEEEILRREQAVRLSQMRDNLAHELELENKRFREKGEERLYEKVRCEKRLLEDKYRCLKEKYVRLKTDVRLSLERRNRRREVLAFQKNCQNNKTNAIIGSETERSLSKNPMENREDHSVSYSDKAVKGSLKEKPLGLPKTQLNKQNISSKCIGQRQLKNETNTSISQSDTTVSNNYSNGRYLPVSQPTSCKGCGTVKLSGNRNSDAEIQEKNNNSNQLKELGGSRKRVFSRAKSASTSRLNSDYKYQLERAFTPVENLRYQLRKLEDLEDQFPDHAVDATFHLRYPFTDISNDHAIEGVGSELEFFKHRIHMERDSVRRAKESLKKDRSDFRLRQRDIKQRIKTPPLLPKQWLDQHIQEEKELTEMEVNLHRTRALLGEKVIRLKHLERSLLCMYEQDKCGTNLDDAATLSDLSSQSSSGFSSTDFASGADLLKRREYFQQESIEWIQNLEILNEEICEILDILSQNQQKQHHQESLSTMAIQFSNDLKWTHMLSQQDTVTAIVSPFQASNSTSSHGISDSSGIEAVPASQPKPTIADRLETYRQLAAGHMQGSMGGAILAANSIVSQNRRPVNYSTSLVKRSRDLRDWLRRTKTEHELLIGTGIQHGITEKTKIAGISEVNGESDYNSISASVINAAAKG